MDTENGFQIGIGHHSSSGNKPSKAIVKKNKTDVGTLSNPRPL